MKKRLFVTLLISLLLVCTGCSSEPVSKLDSYETYSTINETIVFMNTYIEEYSAMLSGFNTKSNLSLDDVHAFENTWKEWATDTTAYLEELKEKSPSSEYSSAWKNMISFIECLEEVAGTLSHWDADGDGIYTSDECNDVISSSREKIIEAQDTFFEKFSTEFLAIPEPTKQTAPSKSTESSEVKTTTRFTNKYGTATTKCAHSGCTNYIASSGDTNCCTTHSSRCLDCNGYIDEDAYWCVSCLAAAADPTCEECGKTATYSIEGITGKTEYYCTTHYNEMKELIEWMENN